LVFLILTNYFTVNIISLKHHISETIPSRKRLFHC